MTTAARSILLTTSGRHFEHSMKFSVSLETAGLVRSQLARRPSQLARREAPQRSWHLSLQPNGSSGPGCVSVVWWEGLSEIEIPSRGRSFIENRTRFGIKTTFALRILSRRQGDFKFHLAHVAPTNMAYCSHGCLYCC